MSRSQQKRGPGRPRNPVSRETLVTAARAVFADEGFAGASVEAIARKAGLRKASMFHHFQSKEALYVEVVRTLLLELGAIVAQAWLAEGSPEQRLDRLNEGVVLYLGSRPGAARILLREFMDRGPLARELGRGALEQLLGQLEQFLREGMKGGAFMEAEPRQLALSLVGMHVAYFAVEDVSAAFTGEDIHASDAVRLRAQEVCRQGRLLCGALPAASRPARAAVTRTAPRDHGRTGDAGVQGQRGT